MTSAPPSEAPMLLVLVVLMLALSVIRYSSPHVGRTPLSSRAFAVH